MTPLHVAAEKGECREIVEYLINKGTDINIKDYNGVSETIYSIAPTECAVPISLKIYHSFVEECF